MSSEERLAHIDKNVTLLLLLVQGNTLDKNDKGLTGKIVEQEARIKKLEDDHKKVTYTVGGMLIIAGYYGWKLFQSIFSAIK